MNLKENSFGNTKIYLVWRQT